ncbi:hypothetical protein K3175_11205 [Qipengyuania sp. GH1]|uniref:hypothetical protein n=1 Tax=Qipengyuania aestuarii TaxID=2867241 RepID=UPI001C86CEB4|nr:hypothetical protein [Qipengyuania aestuarii]MBX7536223.1 hypothetical protein [Qipengyuania aestuarii]
MADINDRKLRDASISEVLERIRAEEFPHIDREVVRELLRLHADPDDADDLDRAVDDLIFARTGD